jgi:hypothetical protein
MLYSSAPMPPSDSNWLIKLSNDKSPDTLSQLWLIASVKTFQQSRALLLLIEFFCCLASSNNLIWSESFPLGIFLDHEFCHGPRVLKKIAKGMAIMAIAIKKLMESLWEWTFGIKNVKANRSIFRVSLAETAQ